jgi:hypothetical protein
VISPAENQKWINPEKLATSGTPDEEKQKKNTTQYVFWTSLCGSKHN